MSQPVNTASAEPNSAHTLFEAYMTVFGMAQQALKTAMQESAEPGLGPLHLRALCLCQREPDSTQQRLVQSMGRDKGQIARLIRDLEERRWLQRIPDAHDRRVWRLRVTQEGAQRCEWFGAIEAQVAQAMLGRLDAQDRSTLAGLLVRLQAGLARPEG